jgi:anti-sigma-K factor RskA
MSERPDPTDYLLGELEEPDRTRAAELERDDPAFGAEVARLKPLVTRLQGLPPDTWENVEPPPLVLPPDATPTLAGLGPGTERARRPRWGGRIVLRPVTAIASSLALLAGGLAVGAALESGGTGGGTATTVASLTLRPLAPAATPALGTARLLAKPGRLEVSLRGVRPSPPGTFYELWLMNSPGDLVSLASFRVPASGKMTMEVPLPVSPGSYHFVDVSLQPANGSPRHSGDSVLRGPVS